MGRVRSMPLSRSQYTRHFTLHNPPLHTLHTTFRLQHSIVFTLHTLHSTPFHAPQSTLVLLQGKTVQGCGNNSFHKSVFVTAIGFVGCFCFVAQFPWWSISHHISRTAIAVRNLLAKRPGCKVLCIEMQWVGFSHHHTISRAFVLPARCSGSCP